MTPFPTELITLFGSSITAGAMRLVSCALEARRQEKLLIMQAMSHRHRLLAPPAKSLSGKEFQWTRRLISILAVFFIIVFPKIVAVFVPEIGIHIGYPQMKSGFLFFTSDFERIQWVHLKGLAITPLDTHLLSAIIGLYFGGSLVGRR